jgi:hypothetical protein
MWEGTHKQQSVFTFQNKLQEATIRARLLVKFNIAIYCDASHRSRDIGAASFPRQRNSKARLLHNAQTKSENVA